jgi:hypothetical protein
LEKYTEKSPSHAQFEWTETTVARTVG